MNLPPALKAVIDELSELPSIGPRQATRLAFYIIDRGQNSIQDLARNIENLKNIKLCARCYFVHMNAGNLCDICSDPRRSPAAILMVEKETDLLSLENTGKYRGIYFITGPIAKTGILEPWQKQRLEALKRFIGTELKGAADELIIGFNPTSVGDFHASILSKEFSGLAKKITRLGRGLPTGGEIEFADDETLGDALAGRSS